VVAQIAGLGTSITYRSTASPRYEARPHEARPPRLRQPSVEHLRTQVSVRVSVARPAWEQRYRKAVIASDLLAIGLSELMHQVWGARAPSTQAHAQFVALEFAAAVLTLRTVRAWDAAELGRGPDEYTRVFRGFLWLALLVGVAGLALKEPSLRPYAFGVTPVALVLAVAGRALLRRQLRRYRSRGLCMRNVIAVGTPAAVEELVQRTRRAPQDGWLVTGVCVPRGEQGDLPMQVGEVPVICDHDGMVDAVWEFGYHVVAIAPDPSWTNARLQELAWDLEGSNAEVVVDPGLMALMGSRLRIDSVDGFPLLRLTEPTLTGVRRLIKQATDLIGATLLLVLLSPLLLGIAIAVRRSGGPVFYRQERVGRAGTTFPMLKFRTMVVGADRCQDALLARNQGAGPLFKIVDDPRVTPVGRWLRRHSLDELPQLFNVLGGSMSLVGPRPPLLREVQTYDRSAGRRLHVKPGMTGLWQVSGRSDLSWEDTVRLDVRYVENWSPIMDLLIMCRTVATVVRGGGAY
jgi:exopolysaccharide biosynthesis polyprenyl glycosylphosphotransferase